MSRKLPLCAVCGASLVGRAHIRLSYAAVKGYPRIGWCEGCIKSEVHRDFLFEDLRKDDVGEKATRELILTLEIISTRGPGRLVTNKDWGSCSCRIQSS